MKLPQHRKARPSRSENRSVVVRRAASAPSVSPAGCCAKVCIFGVCHCVFESPVCP